MSDMRAFQCHLQAQVVANEMLMAHARGESGSLNVTLALEAFGRLCGAVRVLTTNAASEKDAAQ